jgi:hypothetical protein
MRLFAACFCFALIASAAHAGPQYDPAFDESNRQ